MILLDTHTVLWLRVGDPRLGPVDRAEIQRAWESDAVGLSAISFWEMAMPRYKGRMRHPDDVAKWRKEQLHQGLIEIPVDGEIGIRAYNLADFTLTPPTASSWRRPWRATSSSPPTTASSVGRGT